MQAQHAVTTLCAVSAALLTGCTVSGGAQGDGASLAKGDAVTVFAPASLNAAGDQLVAAFEATHDVDITINYAGSSTLVRQLADGAQADVLVTADEETMHAAQQEVPGLSPDTSLIASNYLVLATAPGNPQNIDAITDLADDQVLTGLCASDVPCGRLAHGALDTAGITPARQAEETSVSKVVAKLATGEIDAGFIYTTDAQHLEGVTILELPSTSDNHYPLALTSAGKTNPAAADFAHWLRGQDAQSILADYGFDSAPENHG